MLTSAGLGRGPSQTRFLRRYTRRTEDTVRTLIDIPKRLLGFKLLRRFASALILLLAAWITLFTAFRLYDKAPVRRSPGGLVGAAFCWAGLATVGAAIYPESGLGFGEIVSAALLGLLCSGALRFLYERTIGRIYRRGFGQTPVLLVGDDEG